MNKLINIVSLLFFLSEFILLILKRSKTAEVKIRQDKSSMSILWLAIGLSIFASVYTSNSFPRTVRIPWLEWTGIALVLFGFIFRYTAILQLKKAFTVDVAIAKDHKLKQGGLYKHLRHPSYLGLLLEFLGLSLMFNSWFPLFILNIPVIIALLYRINVEEKFLSEAFGSDYEEYKKRTSRILPGIY